jgi:hypothetical protein
MILRSIEAEGTRVLAFTKGAEHRQTTIRRSIIIKEHSLSNRDFDTITALLHKDGLI